MDGGRTETALSSVHISDTTELSVMSRAQGPELSVMRVAGQRLCPDLRDHASVRTAVGQRLCPELRDHGAQCNDGGRTETVCPELRDQSSV